VDTAPVYVLPPPPPIYFTATPTSATQINLSWASGGPVPATAGYRIAYQPGNTAPANCLSPQVLEGAITGTSHNITGLISNTTYSFRVCAISAAPYSISMGAKAKATTFPMNGIFLSNLATSAVSSTGFTAKADYTGDNNANASVTLFYCNDSLSSGCNPALGFAEEMTIDTGKYSATLTGLVPAGWNEGDVVNLRVIAYDTDGAAYSPSPLNGMVVLQNAV
jgi:hypothetical protein